MYLYLPMMWKQDHKLVESSFEKYLISSGWKYIAYGGRAGKETKIGPYGTVGRMWKKGQKQIRINLAENGYRIEGAVLKGRIFIFDRALKLPDNNFEDFLKRMFKFIKENISS